MLLRSCLLSILACALVLRIWKILLLDFEQRVRWYFQKWLLILLSEDFQQFSRNLLLKIKILIDTTLHGKVQIVVRSNRKLTTSVCLPHLTWDFLHISLLSHQPLVFPITHSSPHFFPSHLVLLEHPGVFGFFMQYSLTDIPVTHASHQALKALQQTKIK